MAEHYLPLPDGIKLEGCWLMLDGQVNMDDLLAHNMRGRIIRMRRPDALRYVPTPFDSYDYLAGWISDAA